ncbi:hypothetical protein HUN39_16675 [Methylocystis sp. FS]|uniref:hypothetical protein n=1 Tax=Methylocystis silviterrae TaxID=2743612 RepID=UPI0015842FB2|nr:hypothetical protein [Methylocystis silviterrae]NUJ81628.1 hypothetical protein [Methylocystis silviterrae]
MKTSNSIWAAHPVRTTQPASGWLPPFTLPLVAIIFFTVGLGPNTDLTIIALLILLVGSALLWRPGEVPILLFVFVMQWIEASIAIFYANVRELDIGLLASTGADMFNATLLTLLGLLALASGMRLAAGRSRLSISLLSRDQVMRTPARAWILLYVVAFVISWTAQILATIIPGLSQPFLVLVNLKWAAFVAFTFATFVKPESLKFPWFIAFLLELISSVGGYFSSFKFVFIFTFLGIAASGVRFKAAQIAGLALVAVAALSLGVVWTAIKPGYRSFVAGDQKGQMVTVSRTEQVGKLVELATNIDSRQISDAVHQLILRISYVEIFGASLDYVPRVIPHAYGEIWLDAISRPFMPRILFPSKSAIDESTLTNKYTGLGVAGSEQGTQVSIGYIGEAYIDFGKFGMMVALFALGLALGRIHFWLTFGRRSRGIIGMGLSSAILLPAAGIGNSSAKMLGALAVSVLVVWLLNRFALPNLLRRLSPALSGSR